MRILISLFLGALTISEHLRVSSGAEYGVDCSFPIHYFDLRCGNLLGDRKKFYEDFMQGCRDYYGDKAYMCDQHEVDRLDMSLRQPQSLVNFTSTGFKKIRAPPKLWKLLSDHWEKNKDFKRMEQWPVGYTYTNHWEAPTYMVSVEDPSLPGAGPGLKDAIWEAAKPTIQEWTQMELRVASEYGIRIYTTGAVLSPHADRLPLVSSCIVNVAQDVDEPWPLEVIDRFGNAVNVTMEPGDMVLYESGSLIHQRPFPMKGRYYANIFIHFEPTGRPLNSPPDYKFEWNSNLPPYLLPGSPWEPKWRSENPYGWDKPAPAASSVTGPEAHIAAAAGDLGRLAEIAAQNERALHRKDRNGWQPIHEAARAGHTKAVEMLIGHGADKNARTHHGTGGTPLNIALNFLSEDHPVVEYLLNVGAVNIGPDSPDL